MKLSAEEKAQRAEQRTIIRKAHTAALEENAAFEDNGQQQEIYTILQKWLDEWKTAGEHSAPARR